MSPIQTQLRQCAAELEKVDLRAAELVAKDIDDAADAELQELAAKKAKLIQRKASMAALVEAEDEASRTDPDDPDGGMDAEGREREQLRQRCMVTRYVQAAMSGRRVDGPEAEFAEAEFENQENVEPGAIPLSIFEPTPEERQRQREAEGEIRHRTVAGLPGTTGTNLQPIFPFVFANSVLPSLRVQMPRVQSGIYSTARISTSQSAEPLAKGSAAMATAAAFAVASATPKRISARLELALEDIATIGSSNYEAALRQNLMDKLSNELDLQGLTGSGTAPALQGLLAGLTAPSDPSNVPGFDDWIALFMDTVDGVWAMNAMDVSMLIGPEAYRLAAKLFRDDTDGSALRGDVSFATYAMQNFGGFRTSGQMPAAASNIQTGIVTRNARTGMTTAICPHWNQIVIDDPYSASASAQKSVTAHILVGDVLVIQPDAYQLVKVKVS